MAVWGGTLAENRIRNSPGSLGDMVAGWAKSGLPAYFQIPATVAGGEGRPGPTFRRRSAGKLADSGSAGGTAFCRISEKSGNQDVAAGTGLRPFGTAVFAVAVGRVLGGSG